MSALLVNQTSGMSEVRRYGLKSGSGADSSKPTLMTRNGRPTYAGIRLDPPLRARRVKS